MQIERATKRLKRIFKAVVWVQLVALTSFLFSRTRPMQNENEENEV
jgi:hypothetical protein